MSLSTALNIAQSSLFNTSRQTSVLSRNVQESSNPDYTRRVALLGSSAPGAHVVTVRRASDEQLFRQNLSAISSWAGQSALAQGLEQLDISINGVDGNTSAATVIGRLQEALQTYSASPSNRSLAESAIDAARQVVNTLNAGSQTIQNLRVSTDREITAAVSDLNTLLKDFKEANDAVVMGTRSGRDVNDALDRRDALLKKISEVVPVTTLSRDAGDMVLMTRDGVTLFETVPRNVTFQPLSAHAPGARGNGVFVDGVPVSLGTGGNTTASGRLAGLLQLRDGASATLQAQLDEVARGLISAFAETSQTGGPAAAGLFTWPGAPAIPADGTLVNGLSATIRLNPAFDTAQGGNPQLLRDGGANGADYVANASGAASYADLLISYSSRLDSSRSFDATAGAGTGMGVADYAAASLGWFQGLRKDAIAASDTKEALANRTAEALSNATGVNVDTEMARLLELEHAYEASARLIKAVDEMLATLLATIR
jgi:flagellar hook-associated protein 1 FlgK